MPDYPGLFSPSLISPETASAFQEGYHIRPLERADYGKGFLECLKALSHVGDVSQQRFEERYDWMLKLGDVHYIVVVEHEGKIVGTAAMMVERKFIHDLGNIGHVEEVSVRKEYQGKGLGIRIIKALSSVARNVGCYKSILGCSEKNEPFYVKCGYKNGGGKDMSQYYEEEKSAYERG